MKAHRVFACIVIVVACERTVPQQTMPDSLRTDSTASIVADSGVPPMIPESTASVDSTVPLDSAVPDSSDSSRALASTYTASDSAAGAVLYRTSGRCFTCHGLHAQGVTGLGPALGDSSWLRGEGSIPEIVAVIRDGVAEPVSMPIRMPALEGVLPDSQIALIARYVFSLSRGARAAPDSR